MKGSARRVVIECFADTAYITSSEGEPDPSTFKDASQSATELRVGLWRARAKRANWDQAWVEVHKLPNWADGHVHTVDLEGVEHSFQEHRIDVAAIVESQRKDMQALADANRQAYEGIKALAERRNEMLKEAFIQWRDAMKGAKGTELLTKQAELARQGVQDAIANVRELAQMEAQSRKEAWKIVQDRFEENLANLKKLLQPK